jgi:hypothetical protein
MMCPLESVRTQTPKELRPQIESADPSPRGAEVVTAQDHQRDRPLDLPCQLVSGDVGLPGWARSVDPEEVLCLSHFLHTALLVARLSHVARLSDQVGRLLA